MGERSGRSRPPWLTVARLVRTQGRRGELVAELLTDFPERLAARSEVFLWDGRSDPRPVAVEKTWVPAWSKSPHKSYLIFNFAGCDSLSAAHELVGQEIQIPSSEADLLPPGSFLVDDLIGCRVIDRYSKTELGRVRELVRTGGTDLLAVQTPAGREILIPFAQELCLQIDLAHRRIEVLLPEGLEDLNPPG